MKMQNRVGLLFVFRLYYILYYFFDMNVSNDNNYYFNILYQGRSQKNI